MMKYTGGVSLTLGLVFGVPAMTLGGGLPDSVEMALGQTLRSLDVMNQLQKELANGKQLPPSTLQMVTEAPLADGETREELHADLREEISLLQTKIDARKLASDLSLNAAATGGPKPFSLEDLQNSMPALPRAADGIEELAKHADPGLQGTFIRALGSSQYTAQRTPNFGAGSSSPTKQPSASKPKPTGSPEPTGQATAKPSATADKTPKPTENSGYSANPLRQAQACYRAGRYEQGALILATVDPDPTVNYWKARLFEKSGRIAEAIELFRGVETNDAAGDLRAAAKREREFAEWRLDFEQRAGVKPVATGKPAPKTTQGSDDQ